MQKICKNCTWCYGYPGNYLCSWHTNSSGNDVRVKETATCSHFSPRDTSGEIKNNDGCFLTSACVKYLGLPDDCKELTVLRNFRDNYLSKTDNGQKMIEEYYAIAPTILTKIEKSGQKNEYFEYIYQIVLSCVESIEQSEFEQTTLIYQTMVNTLKKEMCL